MITILVGDVTEYLAQEAIQLDPQARLITQANCKNLIDGVYFASLGDFENLYEFVKTLEQAQHLIYCPPKSWSDEKQADSRMKFWTEYYLLYFLNKKQISGQDKLPLMLEEKQAMLGLADVRKTSTQQLWVAGCSVSHGVGVDSDQRYGQHLAQKLDLPVSFLTRGGSSVQWAADQILRSNIRVGDIVVWGVTSFARMPFYSDRRILNISATYYDQNRDFNSIIPIERLDDDNMAYNNLGHIHAVINFCAKSQAQLFLFGLLVDYYTLKWTADLPNYTQFYGCFAFDQGLYLDLGTDDIHPGPRMHQWYCEQMFDIIQKKSKKD
jgi:hypothetical protein